jgi:type I restriction enzyme S subunit
MPNQKSPFRQQTNDNLNNQETINVAIGRRKYISYSTYKDSGFEWIGKIPGHWETWRLKFVSFINLGQSPSSDIVNTSGEGLPFLQGNADFGTEHPAAQTFCRTPPKIAESGDILLSVRAPVGALNLADQKYGIGRGLCAIRPNIQILERMFCHYVLQIARYQLDELSKGSTYDAVSSSDVSCLTIPLPSIKEQQFIASFLDHETAKIDVLIEKEERLSELLQEKRTALITQAVTKGLDPIAPMKDSGIEWLGQIPAHWKVKRIKTVASLFTGGTPVGVLEEAFEVEGVPWVKPDNLNGDHGISTPDRALSFNVAKALGIVKSQSSLVCGIGTVGKTGYALFEVCTNQQINAITFGCEVANRFGQFAASCLTQEFMRRANKVTLAICNKSEMGEVPMCVPPLTEQDFITILLDREMAKIDALGEKIREAIAFLKEYRTALVSATVTGKIDVRDMGSQQLSGES